MERIYEPQEVTEKFSEIDKKFSQGDKDLSAQKERLRGIQKLISVIGIVLAISFVTFIIDAFMFHFDEKKRLYDKLEQRDKDIQGLKEEITKLKIFSPDTDTIPNRQK